MINLDIVSSDMSALVGSIFELLKIVIFLDVSRFSFLIDLYDNEFLISFRMSIESE